MEICLWKKPGKLPPPALLPGQCRDRGDYYRDHERPGGAEGSPNSRQGIRPTGDCPDDLYREGQDPDRYTTGGGGYSDGGPGADLVGVNCVAGLEEALPCWRISRVTSLPLSVYANAGIPVTVGGKPIIPKQQRIMSNPC